MALFIRISQVYSCLLLTFYSVNSTVRGIVFPLNSISACLSNLFQGHSPIDKSLLKMPVKGIYKETKLIPFYSKHAVLG